MTISIEKYKAICRITVSSHKHRGNVEAIAKELNLDDDYVRQVVLKIKKRTKRDVAYTLAIMIMETIYVGYQQRVAHLNECLNQLRGAEEADVSACCNAITQEKEEGNEKFLYCRKCNTKTHLHHIHRSQIYKLIQEFVTELREEDKQLLEYADKMGFTGREEAPQNIYRQQIVVIGDQKPSKHEMTERDKLVMKEIEELTPIERRRVASKLVKEITKGEIVEKKVEKKTAKKGEVKNGKNKTKSK